MNRVLRLFILQGIFDRRMHISERGMCILFIYLYFAQADMGDINTRKSDYAEISIWHLTFS